MFLTDRNLTLWELFKPLSLLSLFYVAILYVQRAYFHPLSKFPGPRLAGLSRWYEFYYDVIKSGSFTKKLPALHQKYGKFMSSIARSKCSYADGFVGAIVRIQPEHLHVNDPEFYREYVLVFQSPTSSKRGSANVSAESSIISRITSKLPTIIVALACQHRCPLCLIQ